MTEISSRRMPADEARAIGIVEDLLADKELHTRLAEAGRLLHEATDKLNEKLRDVEDIFVENRHPPCSTTLSKGRWLVWDGEVLMVLEWRDEVLIRNTLLRSSRGTRLEAVDALEGLVQR